MDTKGDKRSFPIAFSLASSKFTATFFLGLFVAIQIVFSPILDNFIAFLLKSYIRLELPHSLETIPFKSVLIFWLLILSIFMIIRYAKAVTTWFIAKKEKIFVASLLLSCHLAALAPAQPVIPGVTVLVVLFLWLIFIFIDDYRIIWSYWYLLFIFLLLSVLLSLVNGGRVSLFAFYLTGLPAFIAFFLMINLIRDRETAIFSLKIYLLLATFSAVIGILQEIIFLYSGISFFVAPNIKELNLIYMLEPTSFGILLRAPALTGWYLFLGYFLCTSLVIGVNLMLYSVFKGKKQRLILVTALVLMSIGLIVTFSRSSMLAVLLAVIVSIFIRWRSLTIHFITIILIGLLVAYFSGFLTNFVEDPKKYLVTAEVGVRIDLLRDGLEGFINKHTFIGQGFYQGAKYTSNADRWNVHNNIVMVAAELGLLGLVTYVALFFAAISRQVVSILELKNEKDKAVLLSLLIALIALMTCLQFQSHYLSIFLFLYLGLVEGTRKAFLNQVNFKSNAKT